MDYEQKLELAGNQLLEGLPLTEDQFDYFFDYYFLTTSEMPYGVAKARTGDPYEWIDDKISIEYEQMNAVLQVVARN